MQSKLNISTMSRIFSKTVGSSRELMNSTLAVVGCISNFDGIAQDAEKISLLEREDQRNTALMLFKVGDYL
jgi:hypothetical protein